MNGRPDVDDGCSQSYVADAQEGIDCAYFLLASSAL